MKRADWLQEMHDAGKNDPEYIAAGLLVDINAQLLLRMQELGISQRKLGEKLGVSQPYLSKVLNLSHNISIGTIVAIAQALDLEVRMPKFVPKEKRAEYQNDHLRLAHSYSISKTATAKKKKAAPVIKKNT